MAELTEVPFRWQYVSADGYSAESESDSAEIRAWHGVHGELCHLALKRSPRGFWQIETSDTVSVSLSWYRMRFRSGQDALDFIGKRTDRRYVPADCYCQHGIGCG